MDAISLFNILRREPHIMLDRFLRPNDIIQAVFDNYADLSFKEKKETKEQINVAIIVATSAHQGVLRKSGEPYIVHPYTVSYILAKMGMDKECIIAGLLHDTVEDTTTTFDEIRHLFGEKVTRLVDGVTKLTNLNIAKQEKQAHAFQKLITFAADDIRVIFIKLIDRLHNMMTLDFMPADKKKRISDETLRFYAPLAHRLGIYWLKEELEALSFYFRYRHEWDQIDRYLKFKYEDPAKVLTTLQDKVRESIEINAPRVAESLDQIYGRIKSYYSIYKKTIKINKSFDSLYDIMGVRVTIDSKDKNDCYLVMAAIHSFSEFTVLNDRFKDYISRPKTNGYMSIHTGIRYKQFFLEVQIRTNEMHKIAEEGNASHWAYKNDVSHKDKTMQWLQQILQDLTDASNPVLFMADIENALPLEKISVFTPKGDLKTLPEGSTLLDFAYAIHGNLGDTCIGGTVNGKKVPIYYKLSNKDEVEVESSRRQRPRPDWLNFVKTNKSKHYIRKFLRKQEKETYIEKGMQKLKPLFDELGKTDVFNHIDESDGFFKISDRYSLPKDNRLNIFFMKVSTGEIKIRKVLQAFFTQEEILRLTKAFPDRIGILFHTPQPVEKEKKTVPVKNKSIYIEGIGELRDYTIAQCCSPEEGDPLIAYISQTRGYILHHKECPELKKAPEERLEFNVYWYTYDLYLIEFIIEIKNTKGALLEVIHEIVMADLNIDSLHLNPQDSTERSGLIYISVKGSDIRQINKLNQLLKSKKSIMSFMINNIKNI